MGATVSQLWTPTPIKVGLIGFHSVGKTAIVHKLSGNEEPVVPSVETVEITTIKQESQQFDIFDYAGVLGWRPCWRSFMSRVHAVAFVIDATDKDSLPEVKQELLNLMELDMLESQPFLILLNKQDVPGAMSVDELTQRLEVQEYLGQELKCLVQGSSAVTGQGLAEGLAWVRQAVRSRQDAGLL